jgi:phosphoribosylformimino-5-aminoimidazole carboxamide ribotide isomerase
MRLIPSIDLRGGRCVRLYKGDFGAETRYEPEPLALVRRYRDFGARWLHIVDLDGARDGRLAHRELIATLAAEPGVRLQVGGGLRTRAVVDDLLSLGVARAVVGSAALEQPDEVSTWLRELGPERVCLAFDARLDHDGTPRLQSRGWLEATPWSLWQAVERFTPAGLRHVLCTDIDRDGALAGPNASLYAEAARRCPAIQWQASGGVSSIADLATLAGAGAAAAISGKALLEGRLPEQELQPFLPSD